MRPHTLDEIRGQTQILEPGSILRKMIETDNLHSIVLYGPPGTGKTTIAKVIANTTNADFKQLNAVTAGKKDIAAVCESAEKSQRRTILFIDEIHRFNKAQQDYLLPFVEQDIVTLIGATTENPFFEVNPALLSRSVLIELKHLDVGAIQQVIIHAMDAKNGLDNKYKIETNALTIMSEQANGDARYALQLLEMAAMAANDNVITVDDVKSVLQKPHLQYDKDGDKHYDTISAFIKSMRGSDPDAVLYYLARLIESGEDPKFIARRIIIAASEDVSNADPMALVIATNAALAVERIGMPEGRIVLAQAALYIAMAPKSNSAIKGIDSALSYLHDHPSNEIPAHLCDAHYNSAAKLGHGVGYDYPHAYAQHWCPQEYLPTDVKEYFYENSHIGYESTQANYQNTVQRDFYVQNNPNKKG